MHVLLEGTPENVDIPKLEAAILAVPGVASIHDLHVWSITSGKHSVNVHIVCSDANPAWPTLLTSVRKMLADDFELHHATVQLEQTPCEQDTEAHAFGPATQNQANKVANPH